MKNDKLLSVKESAEILGVNRQRIQALITEERLPAQKSAILTSSKNQTWNLSKNEKQADRRKKISRKAKFSYYYFDLILRFSGI